MQFDSLLRKRNIPGLNFKYVAYPEEDHNTVPIKSYFDGLRFIYREWEFPPISDEEVSADTVMKHYQKLSQKFGYVILPDEEYFNNYGKWLVQNTPNINNGISLLEMNTRNYPSSSKAFVAIAEAYLTKGDKQRAVYYYKKAKGLAPRSSEIKLKLSELLQAPGN